MKIVHITLVALLTVTSFCAEYDPKLLYDIWGQDGARIGTRDGEIVVWEGCTTILPPTQTEYDLEVANYLAAQAAAEDEAATGILTAKQKYAEHLAANGVPVDATMDDLEYHMDAMIDAATDLAGVKNAVRAIVRAIIRRYAAAERELKAKKYVQ